MDVFQHFDIRLAVLSLQVDDLAADHSIYGSCSTSDFFDDAYTGFGRTLQLGQHFVSLGLQRTACENCDCFSENFMTGRPAAAQIVVVERGQIVVDERIGVQHLQRGSKFFDSRGKGTRDHAASFHTKNGAQTFSPGEHAMTHCLMNGRWILGRRRQELLQRPIGQHTSLLQSLREHVR